MRFFSVTHPRYATDQEFARRNPVRTAVKFRLPGVQCSSCGTWASSNRLRIDVPPEVASALSSVTFVPAPVWPSTRDHWATVLDIDPQLLLPGTEIGPPSGTVHGPITDDFVHPTPGEVWVVQHVAQHLQEHSFGGLRVVPVELTNLSGIPEVQLWSLVPEGRARCRQSARDQSDICDLCGRVRVPCSRNDSIDESVWDGSDFCSLDRNANIIVVTQSVVDVVTRAGFSNVAAGPF